MTAIPSLLRRTHIIDHGVYVSREHWHGLLHADDYQDFALGILAMLLQISILGRKRDFSLNTPLNQVQNYALGGIMAALSITLLGDGASVLIIILIWSRSLLS